MLKIFTIAIILFFNTMMLNGQDKENQTRLTTELERIYHLDQDKRETLNKAQKSYGYRSPEYNTALKEMNFQDSLNQVKVFSIIEKHGWIGKNNTSEHASKAIFYVIQHANLEAQLKYKNMVKIAFENKEISNIEYAMFEDRINVRLGKFQIFGTQNAIDNIGNTYLYPVENIDTVNYKRLKIGEIPINNCRDFYEIYIQIK